MWVNNSETRQGILILGDNIHKVQVWQVRSVELLQILNQTQQRCTAHSAACNVEGGSRWKLEASSLLAKNLSVRI